MPTANVFNMAGEKIGEIELSEAIFGVEPNKSVLHDVVKNHLANCRQGTQSALTKGEVSYTTRKPWRQKGTGRARAGYAGSPVWYHGGVAFAPKPRDYSYTLNKKVRRLALKSALSSKAAEGETADLVPIVNFDPGTLFIGERLTAANGNETPVDYLNEILIQVEGRNLGPEIDRIDFENPNSPEIVYNGRFTFVLGRYSQVSQKFAILSGTLQALKAGDAGVVDLSDGMKAIYSPN